MALSAGALDRRITLRRKSVTKDAFNADVEAWADMATVWASKEEVRDGERLRAEQTSASITQRFQIRWSSKVSDLSAADQLAYAGTLYDIVAVKELGRREGLEISATALANGPVQS